VRLTLWRIRFTRSYIYRGALPRILRPRISTTLIEENVQNYPTDIVLNIPVTPHQKPQIELNRHWRKYNVSTIVLPLYTDSKNYNEDMFKIAGRISLNTAICGLSDCERPLPYCLSSRPLDVSARSAF